MPPGTQTWARDERGVPAGAWVTGGRYGDGDKERVQVSIPPLTTPHTPCLSFSPVSASCPHPRFPPEGHTSTSHLPFMGFTTLFGFGGAQNPPRPPGFGGQGSPVTPSVRADLHLPGLSHHALGGPCPCRGGRGLLVQGIPQAAGKWGQRWGHLGVPSPCR